MILRRLTTAFRKQDWFTVADQLTGQLQLTGQP